MARLKYRLKHTNDRFAIHVCTIPSATVTQAMAAAGADGVLIDMEHGAVDHGTAHAMIAATAGTDCAAIVRVSRNDPAEVKRVLDLGAEGICFPLIRTAEDAAAAVFEHALSAARHTRLRPLHCPVAMAIVPSRLSR
ncbi:MAG: hypothetical protein HC814_03280 [Rhodobacteraceae bacterium]|nr:hypothetical protein [Paracoccaceae bacterium]